MDVHNARNVDWKSEGNNVLDEAIENVIAERIQRAADLRSKKKR